MSRRVRRLFRAIGRFLDAVCIDTMPTIPPPPPKDFHCCAPDVQTIERIVERTVENMRHRGLL